MSLGYIGVDIDSQAGLVFDCEVTILPERAFVRDEIGPPVDPFCEFVDAEAAHGGGCMDRCDGTDGACGIVGGGPDLPQTRFRRQSTARPSGKERAARLTRSASSS